MNVSILTPCYNSHHWIRQCAFSVADQQFHNEFADPPNIAIHHHVQDGGSTDGTVELLSNLDNQYPPSENYKLSYVSENDSGMYNALNAAYYATEGEIIGHLNADEQYLPGTMAFVTDYFNHHPRVDVLFGAVVVVDPQGEYLCSRMPMKPQLLHTQVCHLSVFTASMFFRRSAMDRLSCYFDESFKTAGDADLVCRMFSAGIRMETVRRYLSVFIETGGNLALSDQAAREKKEIAAKAPMWAQKGSGLVETHHRLRKLVHRAYWLKPFTYRFIRPDGTVQHHEVPVPTGRWLNRL